MGCPSVPSSALNPWGQALVIAPSAIESGQLRFLVMLKEGPSAEYPGIPILKNFGYEIPCPMNMSIFGPSGINPAIAKKLEDAFTRAMME